MAGPAARSPLPQLTLDNEVFWTSGADGRLRILGCESCSALIHPPQPVCRYCHGHALSPVPVSGFATLIGFTVSHRFAHPGLPSPYVVAHVMLEEDPRVRLVTNAVECSPSDLSLGMRMEVVFEQAEDVWLPLFRPAAEQPASPASLSGRPSSRRALAPCAADDPGGQVRGQVRHHRHRPVAGRPPPDALPGVAGGRGRRAGRRGRRAHVGLIHEAVTQLRGSGGARQVANARVAVVATGGLTTSGVLLLRSEA